VGRATEYLLLCPFLARHKFRQKLKLNGNSIDMHSSEIFTKTSKTKKVI